MSPPPLLSCDAVSRRHGTRTLFEGVSFGVTEGDRIGLVGPNGSGKTTLLRLLAGLESPDAGRVARRKNLRMGFVEQSPEMDPADSAATHVAHGLADLGLEDYEISTRVEIVLGRAGLVDPNQLVGHLSGGRKKRLALARELAREPDVLLLDEPTNHLDVEGILWLEELLANARHATLVVSHDRTFLQNVASRIMELNRAWPGGLFQVRGTYADFVEKKEEALAGQLAAERSLANVVRREIEWLRRGPKARTTKSQARIDEAARLQAELAASRARTATSSANIDFTSSGRRSKRLLVADGVSKTLGTRRILDNLHLTLLNGMRLGVLGPNGAGKTTLLKLLSGELEPDADGGRIERASGLVVARFEQDRASLDPTLSLARALAPAGDAVTWRGEQVHISSWARRFLFRTEQLQLPVGRLSGGEQARILVARMMLQPADLLLLDEPTNDLDIPTLEVLEESLAEFPGALVLVTHDRYVLDRVATSLISVGLDGQVEAHADLDQWEAARRRRDEPRAVSATVPMETRQKVATKGLKALSQPERREWDGMEKRIVAAEARVAAARAAAEDPAIASDSKALHAAHEALVSAEADVTRLYSRWTELETKQKS